MGVPIVQLSLPHYGRLTSSAVCIVFSDHSTTRLARDVGWLSGGKEVHSNIGSISINTTAVVGFTELSWVFRANRTGEDYLPTVFSRTGVNINDFWRVR